MSSPAAFEPRRFRSTVPYYARFRLPYPDLLILRVIDLAALRPGDRVMDLGCGPGLLAIAFAKAGMEVVAVDPEPEMLAAARAAASEAHACIETRIGSSFELPPGLSSFRLLTIGRAFHWMDREETLDAFDRRLAANCAIALFDDDHPRTAENGWRFALRDIGNRYGRSDSLHVIQARHSDYRTHEAILLGSAFSQLVRVSEFVRRSLTADEIVGLAFSLSTSSPERLGERTGTFERDLRSALVALSPTGKFTEIAELSALVARRPFSETPP